MGTIDTESFDSLQFRPPVRDSWSDFVEALDGDGARGCWCSWLLLEPSDFRKSNSEQRSECVREYVGAGEMLGLIVYGNREPIGWVSIAPRESLRRLNHSLVANSLLVPNGDIVWIIGCLYIRRRYRRMGFEKKVIEGAVRHASSSDCTLVAAFPIDSEQRSLRSDERYHGDLKVFLELGFRVMSRPTPRRAVVTYRLHGQTPSTVEAF